MAKVVGVKLKDGQAAQFERAALAVGKTVPTWLRDLGAAAIAPPVPAVEMYPRPSAAYRVVEGQAAPQILPGRIPEPLAFGKDAVAFLAERGAQSPIVVPAHIMMPDVDEWESRCVVEFGGRAVNDAVKYLRGWAKMDWQKRYEAMREQHDNNSGNNWA